MRTEADHDEPGHDVYRDAADEPVRRPGDANTYWRRRFLILCGGVVALGLCAWLFPGAHQTRPSAAVHASMAALASSQALPAAATGAAWSPSPAPTPTPTPSASPSASATHKPKPKASASAGSTRACKSVVLSLSTSQSSYTTAEQPEFKVYAVSTAPGSCTLPYGAGSVKVIVTHQGQVVWDSAACRPKAAKPVKFAQGIPQVLTLSWDPAAAGPGGCAGALTASTSATLDAVAQQSGKSSPAISFKVTAEKKKKAKTTGVSTRYQPRKS